MSGSQTYMSHEQVLIQAEDYISIKKEDQCFNFLNDFILSIKRRGAWTLTFEKIMITYINLGVQQEKHQHIKDALVQYRYMSQNANIASMEYVINYYRDIIEKLYTKSIDGFDQKVIEDLDLNESQEEILLFAVDTPQNQNVNKLRQRLKLLIDTYKSLIEIVRINNRLEDVMVALSERLYKFCVDNKRKVELKRYCHELRVYLYKIVNIHSSPYPKTQFTVDITSKDTNQKYCHVYQEQLSACFKLDLWQDAFRSIEDLQIIMNMSRSQIKPRLLSQYFESLSMILWKSEYFLYHAYAFHSHYQIFKKFSKARSDELVQKTDLLILSLLSIPPVSQEMDQKSENRQRIGWLVSSSGVVPTKSDLLNIAHQTSALDLASSEVKDLFYIMERDFNLLTFAKKSSTLINVLKQNPSYCQFILQIEQNLFYKALESTSKVFKTIKLETLRKFLQFQDNQSVEQAILMAQSQDIVNVKINHEKNILIFTNKGNNADIIDASQQILEFSQNLQCLCDKVDEQTYQEDEQLNRRLIKQAKQYLIESQLSMGDRMEHLAKLKTPENFRKMIQNQILDETERRQKEQQLQRAQEKERKEQDEEKQQQAAEKKLELIRKKKLLQEIIKQKGSQVVRIEGKKVENITVEQLELIDENTFEELKQIIEDKEKQNLENKEKRTLNKADFLTRAKREQEIKKIQKSWENNSVNQDSIISVSKQLHEKNLKLKHELAEAQKFKDEFMEKITKTKKAEYEKNIADFTQKVQQKYKQNILELAKEQMAKDIEEKEKQKQERLVMEQNKEKGQEKEDSGFWRSEKQGGQTESKQEEKLEDKGPSMITRGNVQRNNVPAEQPSLGWGRKMEITSKPDEKKDEKTSQRLMFTSNKSKDSLIGSGVRNQNIQSATNKDKNWENKLDEKNVKKPTSSTESWSTIRAKK